MAGRLSLALEKGIVTLSEGETLVIGATTDSDLGALDKTRTRLFARHANVHNALSHQGWTSVLEPEAAANAVVFAPRERPAQRACLKLAREITTGPIIVDGSKTNGIDPLYRELRDRANVSEAWSKAHGKVFTVSEGSFEDWPDLQPARDADGWWRAPGVFSADGIDKASAFLAEMLPADLAGRVVDLGAGWGFLSKAILERSNVSSTDMVENDNVALDAAHRNVPRATGHWADALVWQPENPVDHVVTNPPFHVGRAADPSLGQAFIRAAAAMLKPKGQLWLVANRHLPYENTLKDAFRTVELHAENPSFKIFHATSPNRRKG